VKCFWSALLKSLLWVKEIIICVVSIWNVSFVSVMDSVPTIMPELFKFLLLLSFYSPYLKSPSLSYPLNPLLQPVPSSYIVELSGTAGYTAFGFSSILLT
jgi:hypothetical protein